MKLSPNAGITIIMYHIFLTYTWHILHGFWSLVSFVWKENEQSTVCQQHKQWSVAINQEHNKEIVIAGAKQDYCHQILEYIKEAVE